MLKFDQEFFLTKYSSSPIKTPNFALQVTDLTERIADNNLTESRSETLNISTLKYGIGT